MWLKRIIGIALTLIAIIVLAAVALVLFVDPNHYKSFIVDAVQKNTDRTLSIEGNMSWRFWPGVGLEIDNVTLSNAPGFGDTPFVKMGAASVYVRLLPLLTKNIYVDKLELENAEISLARHKDGTTNWSDLIAANDPPANAKIDTKAVAEPEAQKVNLKIAEVVIVNSQLTWDDQMLGQTRTLSNFSFSGAIGTGTMEPFTIQGVASLKPENVQYVFDAKGKYALDLAAQSFAGKNWEVNTKISGVKNLPQTENVALTFDSLAVDMSKGNVAAKKLVLTAIGGQVNFSGEGANIFKSPIINGSLSATNIDVKAIAMLFNQPIETMDPNVLRNVNIEAKAMGSENRFTFDPINIKVDDTTLNGQLAVNDWQKKEIAFSLTGDQIDLDRYMAPQTQAAAQGTTTTQPKSTASTGEILSTETQNMLRTLTMSGHLAMGKMTIQKMPLSNLSVDLNAKNGIVQIAPFKTTVFEGALVANGALNVQGAQPRWNIDVKLGNLNLSPMLKQFAAKEVMTGHLSLDSQLQTVGANSNAILQALNGTAIFNIDNGVLQGVDLGYWLAVGQSMLNKKAEAVTAKNTGQTRFLAASGKFLIKNGVANNQNLVMYNESIYMHGAGEFNLVNETINYAVQVDKTKQTADGKYASADKGIPLRITGTFSQPVVGVDLKGLQSNLIKGLIGGAIGNKLSGEESSSSGTSSSGSSSSTTTQQSKQQQARDKLKNILQGL